MNHRTVIFLLTCPLTLTISLPAQAEPDRKAIEAHAQRLVKNMDQDNDGQIIPTEASGPIEKYFKRIDKNSDGRLSQDELATALYQLAQRREQLQTKSQTTAKPSSYSRPQAKHRTSRPVPDPWLGYGHNASKAMRGATYLKSAGEIQAIVGKSKGPLSYPKSTGLRIVGTGHSWMVPGYRTLPAIAEAAGVDQQLRTHTSGGETGAVRMMWEKENGILEHQGRPVPICMAAITTGQWDVMCWGCYTNDRPEYYFAWIDFCLKYNPDMKFYVFNAWPQWADGFGEGDGEPRIENYRARAEKIHKRFDKMIDDIDRKYPGRVRILPTCDAMMAAIELYFKGELPGVQGLNRKAENVSPCIWSDGGHLGVGMDRLEGYVFYATLYQRSPELIEADLPMHNSELDRVFRKIAWQAVTGNPLSGVTDKNGNGIGDAVE